MLTRHLKGARSRDQEDELEWLNDAMGRLEERTRRYTFDPLRQLFLGLVLDGVAPRTTAEAEALITSLPEWPRDVPRVPRDRLEGIVDDARRELLLRVHDSDLGKVRNEVVHKSAYRPVHDVAQRLVDDAWAVIPRLTHVFDIRGDEHHLNERLEHLSEPT